MTNKTKGDAWHYSSYKRPAEILGGQCQYMNLVAYFPLESLTFVHMLTYQVRYCTLSYLT